MATMARSILAPKPQPLSATTVKIRSNRHFQIALSPLKIARSTTTPVQRGGLVLVSVATEASTKEPAPSSANKGNAKSTGSNPPTIINSSGLSIQFPDIPSTWSTLLIGAAVFLSVSIYRRIKKVEEGVEKVEEAAETTVGALDKAAEEAEQVAAELAKTSSNGIIKEGLIERIERDAEKAEGILHKVEHITDEVEKMLGPIVERAEIKEKKGKKENHDNSDDHNHDI